MSKKNRDYLSNKEMLEEIKICQANGGQVSDKLAKMFMLLCNRFARKPNYSGYSYKDEMIANAILACLVAFDKFDPEKSNNPFAYFTQCIYHSFLQVLNKEKKHQIIRDELLIDNDMDPSNGYIERYEEEMAQSKIDDSDD